MPTVFMNPSTNNRRDEPFELEQRRKASSTAEELKKLRTKRNFTRTSRPSSNPILAMKLKAAAGLKLGWLQRKSSEKNSKPYLKRQCDVENNGQNPTAETNRSDQSTQNYKQPPPKQLPEAETLPRGFNPGEDPTLTMPRTPDPPESLPSALRTRDVAFQVKSSNETAIPATIPPSPPTTMPLETSERPPRIDVNLNNQNYGDQVTAFEMEWSYIAKWRIDILTQRSKSYEMRVALRKKRDAYSNAADKFLQRIRMRELGIESRPDSQESEQKAILELLQDVQDASNEYGPFEHDCNEFEDKLYRDEFELHRQEEQFYKRWKVVPVLTNEALNSPVTLQINRSVTDLAEQDDEFKFHPLVAEYLSKKGTLGNLRERLDDLEDEMESLEDQSETRKQVGLSLAAEEQIWLDNSDSERRKLLSEISQSEKDLEEIRRVCIAMKLVDEEGDPIDTESAKWGQLETDGVDSGSQISEYSRFSILLPGMDGKDLEKSSVDKPKPEEKSPTLAEHVNVWMLGTLRCSAVDANNLARISEGKGVKNHGEPWQEAVLRFWFHDETSEIKDAQGYSSSLTTQAHHHQQVESQPSPLLAEICRYQPHRPDDSSEVVCQSEDTETTETAEIAEEFSGLEILQDH